MTKEEHTLYTREWRKKNPDKVRAASKKYYQKHALKLAEKSKRLHREKPELMAAKNRRKYLKKKWGLTVAEYEQMLHEQGGNCRICGRPPMNYRLSVDHDHATGKIRGLLCARCNRAIALLWEDISIMKNAITYLEEVTLR